MSQYDEGRNKTVFWEMNKNKDFQVGGPEKNMDVGQEVQMLDIKKDRLIS